MIKHQSCQSSLHLRLLEGPDALLCEFAITDYSYMLLIFIYYEEKDLFIKNKFVTSNS